MSEKKGGFFSSLGGFIIFLVVLFIIYNVIGNFINPILEAIFGAFSVEDSPPTEEELTDIALEYYQANPVREDQEAISSSLIQWQHAGRWWQTTWQIPDDVLGMAMNELRDLEDTARYSTDHVWLDNKYYNTITSSTSTVNEFWGAVYKAVRDLNEERVERISDVFKYARDKYNIRGSELINMVVSFTQYIDYMIPKDTIFEILPPLNSIIRDKGDCDTKSILLAMILEDLGHDALLLYSSHYLHAITAVERGSGVHLEYKNKKFYTIETTAIGWKVGMIPSDVDDLSYWFPIDL